MFEPARIEVGLNGPTDEFLLNHIVATILLTAALAGIRILTGWLLGRLDRLKRLSRRRWLVRIRNATIVLFVLGFALIWFDQILEVATAVALVAAGFAIATKELWLNISGYLFRSGAHFFTVGDRIEVGDFRGDVIDQGPMGATVLEIGSKSHQHTGRAVFIPNGKFLSAPVINETFFHEFMFHTITVPMKASSNWRAAEQALLQAAQEVCAPYLERVRARMEELSTKSSLDTPATEPRVQIHLPEPDRISLLLRVPIMARRRGRTEQRIIRRYLELLSEGTTSVIEQEPTAEPEAVTTSVSVR
jgi:small-conductance mechanosensitive channel